MNVFYANPRRRKAVVAALLGLLFLGCATSVDWKTRVGSYTYDDALKELGPPDKVAVTSDQLTVAEWMTSRGMTYGTISDVGPIGYRGYYRGGISTFDVSTAPSRYLRLIFTADKHLQSFRQFSR